MNKRTKSLVAGGLGGLAALVWIPQLFPERSALPRRAEVSAEAGASLFPDLSFLSSAREEETPGDASGPAPDLEALERETVALEERARPRVDSEIARLLARMEETRVEPSALPAATGEVRAREDRRELERFAQRNALTGILRGSQDSAALLGHRVVRVGDRLDGGRVIVAEVGSSWLRLVRGDEELILELPAFQASGRAPRDAEPGVDVPANSGAGAERSATGLVEGQRDA